MFTINEASNQFLASAHKSSIDVRVMQLNNGGINVPERATVSAAISASQNSILALTQKPFDRSFESNKSYAF